MNFRAIPSLLNGTEQSSSTESVSRDRGALGGVINFRLSTLDLIERLFYPSRARRTRHALDIKR